MAVLVPDRLQEGRPAEAQQLRHVFVRDTRVTTLLEHPVDCRVGEQLSFNLLTRESRSRT